MWAEGSFTSLFHVFLTVPSSSQVSLVQPWDDLEKSSFCSIAARWRVQTWGQLVRWSAGLPKPSWIIYVPDLATVCRATASCCARPCDSAAVPGSPATLETSVGLPPGSCLLTHTILQGMYVRFPVCASCKEAHKGQQLMFLSSLFFSTRLVMGWYKFLLHYVLVFIWLHMCHPCGGALFKMCWTGQSSCLFFFLQGRHELLIFNEFLKIRRVRKIACVWRPYSSVGHLCQSTEVQTMSLKQLWHL